MKFKKVTAVLTAFIVLALSCGCDDKTNSDSAKSGADTSSSSSVSEDGKDSESEVFNVMDLPDLCDRNAQHEGVYVAKGMTTGVNLYIPAELKLYNGVVYEDQSCCPEEIPTVDAPFIVTDMEGKNNFQYTISKGTDNKSFVSSADKDEYLAAFQQAAEGVIDDIDITVFETARTGNYPAIKIVSTGKINGEEFEQTQLIVNACNIRADMGVTYTFTYTDFTGALSGKIDDSISSIDFVNVDAVRSVFLSPDELVTIDTDAGAPLQEFSGNDGQTNGAAAKWYSRIEDTKTNNIYKIRIPEGWEFVSGCDGSILTDDIVIAQPASADGATIIFTKEWITEENNYDDLGKEDYLNIIAASVEKAEVISYEEGTENQYQTRRISYKVTQSGVDMTMTQYVAYNTEKAFACSTLLTDPNGNYQDIADTLNEYVNCPLIKFSKSREDIKKKLKENREINQE